MSVSLEYLGRCSAETGFSVMTLEKVTRLGELAAAIAVHPLLGNALALKGGTAFNLCFGDAPSRLSVDLDYNYIAHAERDSMLRDRPQVEESVEMLAGRLGYRVRRSADAFAGRKIYAMYRSVLGHEDRVEVDLNYLWRVPLSGVEQQELWQPGNLDRPRLQVVSTLELCVGKLLAFLDRTAPRDAWDVARLPNIAGQEIQGNMFRRVFVAFSATLPHPLQNYTRKQMGTRLTPQTVLEQLLPMLAGVDAPGLDDLMERPWRVLEPLVQLTAAELEYVESIHSGEIRPQLLFPDDAIMAKLIHNHPAICWKLENVRRHMANGKRTRPKGNVQ